MSGCPPSLINFGVFDAPPQHIFGKMASHLARWNMPLQAVPSKNDWGAFFVNDGNLFDFKQVRIFLFGCQPYRTAYLCNLSDGWHSLFWNIAQSDSTDGAYFRTTTRPDVQFGAHDMQVWRTGRCVRHLRTLQEERGWEFLNRGDPLPFEEVAGLKSRRIRDRFGLPRVVQYCQAFGLNFADTYSYTGDGILIRPQ